MTTELPLSLGQLIVPGSSLDRRRNWTVFRVFNLYRLILAAALLGIFIIDDKTRFLGQTYPSLFLGTAVIYMILVLLAIAGSYFRRPPLPVQAHIQTLVDLVGLSLLIHASGGIGSHLSILLVTAIAASSILLPLYSALATAALAFFIILGHWFYEAWTFYAGTRSFLDHLLSYSDELGRLGILGASFFIAALLTYTLAERARRSDQLARQRSLELLELATLNQAIVQHLQSGVIVVDPSGGIRVMNDTARDLLNHQNPAHNLSLDEIAPALHQRHASWQRTGTYDTKPFSPRGSLPQITVRFSRLGGNRNADTLIFIEDFTQVSQRLQQLKLAALGRLTASIAHEIRNPLASISHAAQLLQESTTASTVDKRLSQIIHDNTKRANKTITSVLDLSRRDKIKLEDIVLQPWLETFSQEFCRGYNDGAPDMEMDIQPADLTVRFDLHHLHQILWNLCTNACLHGALPDQPARIRLTAGLDGGRLPRPYLDVIDFGPGISEEEARKLFEPFFTTKAQGTGLGLYISQEMCQASGAQLQYIRPSQGGSCFRITFANSSTAERES